MKENGKEKKKGKDWRRGIKLLYQPWGEGGDIGLHPLSRENRQKKITCIKLQRQEGKEKKERKEFRENLWV